jgi:hypothetical protein
MKGEINMQYMFPTPMPDPLLELYTTHPPNPWQGDLCSLDVLAGGRSPRQAQQAWDPKTGQINGR